MKTCTCASSISSSTIRMVSRTSAMFGNSISKAVALKSFVSVKKIYLKAVLLLNSNFTSYAGGDVIICWPSDSHNIKTFSLNDSHWCHPKEYWIC